MFDPNIVQIFSGIYSFMIKCLKFVSILPNKYKHKKILNVYQKCIDGAQNGMKEKEQLSKRCLYSSYFLANIVSD